MILDQGVGFIRTCGYENHPFNQTPKSQANHLRKSSFTVGQTETSVPVYVMRGEEQNGHQ